MESVFLIGPCLGHKDNYYKVFHLKPARSGSYLGGAAGGVPGPKHLPYPPGKETRPPCTGNGVSSLASPCYSPSLPSGTNSLSIFPGMPWGFTTSSCWVFGDMVISLGNEQSWDFLHQLCLSLNTQLSDDLGHTSIYFIHSIHGLVSKTRAIVGHSLWA